MSVDNVEQARSIVRNLVVSTWEYGTLAFSGLWYEDEEAFIVYPAAIEWLRDHKQEFEVIPGAFAIVDKVSGEVSWEVYFPGKKFAQRLTKAVEHNDGDFIE